ncbi:hypothetical protein EG328_003688 [Venturia inaequalis]|uniref:Uncharacterized protein n=1 Tax=Venturia inaequalis TaxID=5025 RepID=A0A8H3VUU1_VENIN|nr:hypothetical protein EG328_003688 [Venturia inaequalis]KAE9994213.1 hypothetical protein EG327_000495 [Venturia inaequalis]RDI87085.1 hypothetical protein Vi05172_g2751 [Venturia inaequalis]
MSAITNHDNAKGGEDSKNSIAHQHKKEGAAVPTTLKKKARGKNNPKDLPNPDGSLKFLPPNSDHSLKSLSLDLLPDSSAKFRGFMAYEPKRDFELTPEPIATFTTPTDPAILTSTSPMWAVDRDLDFGAEADIFKSLEEELEREMLMN